MFDYQLDRHCSKTRGASSGTYELNINGAKVKLNYGDEFRSIAKFSTSRGEVKVVENTLPGRHNSPMETMTDGRIYAKTDHTGHISIIVFFDDNGKRSETWHIATNAGSHTHGGTGNHKHYGYYHDEGGRRKLSKSERRYAREVERKWARELKRTSKGTQTT